MSDNRSNQTAVITGASSGIGLGLARAFLERGATVVMNGRNEANLVAAADNLGQPDRIAVVAGDVGDPATGRRLVEAAVERFGRVDVLVNNAGAFASKPLLDYSEDDLTGFLTNLKGAYFTTQAAVQRMREQGGGSITNITTILTMRGVTAIPSSAPIAAKGGIHALTTSLAVELARDNIRVNAVAPGLIKTPIHGMQGDEFNQLNGLQPLGRLGEVSDVVDAVLYLTDASFVTGVILPVDGGAAAGG